MRRIRSWKKYVAPGVTVVGKYRRQTARVLTRCFVCGGSGYVDKQDYEWKSQWGAETSATAGKAKGSRRKAAQPAPKSATTREAGTRTVKKKVVTKPDDTSGRSPLHLEASDGNLKQVRQLLESGADPNARDADGRAPIHWPALRGHVEVVRALLDYHADANARDTAGRTPLRMATIGNQQAIIDLLREHGGEL